MYTRIRQNALKKSKQVTSSFSFKLCMCLKLILGCLDALCTSNWLS